MQLGGLSLDGTWYRIVGVARRIQPRGIGSAEPPAPTIYLPLLQIPSGAAALAVRTGDDPLAILPAVQHAVSAADSLARSSGASTLEAELARFRSPLRWLGVLFAVLAAITTLLAAIGLFGVVSLSVRQRTRELGIRMALGARESAVVRMVALQGLRLTLLGLAFGLAGALVVGRLLQFYFAGVRLSDPLPYAATAFVLLTVAHFASRIPARAAARVDPVVALQAE
ncbi:MAG TPA: FtsX-like permease family protein, partial [Longimicrobiaceae bacterium]|nr:FtsX-like permease family protein [Longimicrobiaceae bacterium]